MQRKRRSPVVPDDDTSGGCRPKKRRRTEKTAWVYVLRVFQGNLRNPVVSVRGLLMHGRRSVPILIDVHNQRPVVYFREVEGATRTRKDLIERLRHRRVNLHGAPATVSGKPLFGYQPHTTPYTKITLASECDRILLAAIAREENFLNLFETGVSTVERFCSATGVAPGRWVELDASALARVQRGRAAVLKRIAPFLLRKQPDLSLLELPHAGEILRCADSAPQGTPEPIVSVAAFRYIFRSIEMDERTVPFATLSQRLRREWMLAGSGDEDYLTPTPIDSICIETRRYGVHTGQQYGQAEKMLLTTRSHVAVRGEISAVSFAVKSTVAGSRTDPVWLMKNPHARGEEEKENRRELAMAREFVKVLSAADFVVGFQLMAPLADTSLAYALERMRSFGATDIMTGTSSLQRMDKYLRTQRNPLRFTSCIDLLNYATTDLAKCAPTSSFRDLYNVVMAPDEAGCWASFVCRTDVPLPYESAMTYSRNVFALFEHECVLQKTLSRAAYFGVPPGEVWTAPMPRVMRLALFREIASLERSEGYRYVVGARTPNAWKFRDAHFADPSDRTSSGRINRGGRVLDPMHPLLDVAGFSLDYKSYFPSIVIGAGLGYANLIVEPARDGLQEPNGPPMAVARTASNCVAFVRGVKMPLVRVLRGLMQRRNRVRGMEQTPYVAAENVAVKLLMNATIGCLAFRGKYVFKCAVIGEVTRWICRRLFDAAVCVVSYQAVLHHNDGALCVTDEGEGGLARFKVVAGHTDGFDVVAVDADEPDVFLDLNNTAPAVAKLLADFVLRRLRPADMGLVPATAALNQTLQVERVFRRIAYFHANAKVWAPFPASKQAVALSKGTFDRKLANCALTRAIYKEALATVVLGADPWLSVSAWLREFDRRTRTLGPQKERVRAFTEYHRVTPHRAREKFNAEVSDDVARALREAQQTKRVPIPAVGQHVPLLWVIGPRRRKPMGFGDVEETYAVHASLHNASTERICVKRYRDALQKELNRLVARISSESRRAED